MAPPCPSPSGPASGQSVSSTHASPPRNAPTSPRGPRSAPRPESSVGRSPAGCKCNCFLASGRQARSGARVGSRTAPKMSASRSPEPDTLQAARRKGLRAGTRHVKARAGDLAGSSPSAARGPHRALKCGRSWTGVRTREGAGQAGPRGTRSSLRTDRGAQGLGGQKGQRRGTHSALAVHAGSRGLWPRRVRQPCPGGPFTPLRAALASPVPPPAACTRCVATRQAGGLRFPTSWRGRALSWRQDGGSPPPCPAPAHAGPVPRPPSHSVPWAGWALHRYARHPLP